ncbi:MAG: immunoglobulin domain-containing protein [Campylobacteraceae bacterium]|nr:immunoglobulin domain-containing protein [Campylobacteraceae bacterium]
MKRSLYDYSKKFFTSTNNVGKALIFIFALTLVGCGEAQTPSITVQPKSKIAKAGTQSTLKVSATVSDGGVLTYQWYKNDRASNEGGTLINDQISDTLTFTVPTTGAEAYYYVVVTNVNSEASGVTDAKSDVAVITIVNYDVSDISFYDKDLQLVDTITVERGDEVTLADYHKGPWYAINSRTEINVYVANSNANFYATYDVFAVRTPDELRGIRTNLTGKFVLLGNIDLTGTTWEPIGTESSKFSGVLNGNGYTIKGLTINDTTKDYVGLFGYIEGGSVIDLRLELGSNGIQGRDYVGPIAGYANRATITAVVVEGIVKGRNYVGGIVGSINLGTITATTSRTTITASGDYAGSITGKINLGTITASYSKGNIENTGKYTGGIAGYSDTSTITATFTDGNVKGDDYTGGIAGYLRFGTIVASYLHGRVSGGTHTDGLVGHNSYGIVLASLADGLPF